MAILDISIVPVGTGAYSLSRYVARAVKILEGQKDIKYESTPMGTVMEGELGRLLPLAHRMHETAFDSGCERVVTVIKIDDRRDKAASMSGKLASLKREMER